jgi:hypothetical protein
MTYRDIIHQRPVPEAGSLSNPRRLGRNHTSNSESAMNCPSFFLAAYLLFATPFALPNAHCATYPEALLS